MTGSPELTGNGKVVWLALWLQTCRVFRKHIWGYQIHTLGQEERRRHQSLKDGKGSAPGRGKGSLQQGHRPTRPGRRERTAGGADVTEAWLGGKLYWQKVLARWASRSQESWVSMSHLDFVLQALRNHWRVFCKGQMWSDSCFRKPLRLEYGEQIYWFIDGQHCRWGAG